MKKNNLLIGLILIITGCTNYDSAESLNLQLGDRVEVLKGFYKGCSGFITEYEDYEIIDDKVLIREVFCPKATSNYIRVEAKFVQKVEK